MNMHAMHDERMGRQRLPTVLLVQERTSVGWTEHSVLCSSMQLLRIVLSRVQNVSQVSLLRH
jgi:hypothetical protein